MTVEDLLFDRVTPDAPGLVLAVTDPDSVPLGTLRSAMVGRPNRQVLRWQAFNPDGTVSGPIWSTREGSAVDLLPQEFRLAMRQAQEQA